MRWTVVLLLLLAGCTGHTTADITIDGTQMAYEPSQLEILAPNGGDWGLLSLSSDHKVHATLNGETIVLGDDWQTFSDGPMHKGDIVEFCTPLPAWTVVLNFGTDRSEGSVNVQMEVCG